MTSLSDKLFVNILLSIIKDWLIMQLYLNFNKNAKIIENKCDHVLWKAVLNTSEEQPKKINFTVLDSMCLEVSDCKVIDDFSSSKIIVKLNE